MIESFQHDSHFQPLITLDQLVYHPLFQVSNSIFSLMSGENNEWKPVIQDKLSQQLLVPNGTMGQRWEEESTCFIAILIFI
jgi:nitrate reductase alpha subunit